MAVLSLPETRSLLSAHKFAESKLSDTHHRWGLPSVALGKKITLSKESVCQEPNSQYKMLGIIVSRSRGYKREREEHAPKYLGVALLRVLHIGCSLPG